MRGAKAAGLIAVLATAPLGIGACVVSLSGLTGGDAGPCSGADCGAIAPREGGAEGSLEASVTPDAGSDAPSCLLVPTDASLDDDAACGLSDGSTCGPGSVHGPLTLVPWEKPKKVCTDQQLSDFYSLCVQMNGGDCKTFQSAPGNGPCSDCILSFSTDSTYGAIVIYQLSSNQVAIIDVPGCIAALDPCQTPCATAIALQAQCVHDACIDTCPENEAGTSGFLGCLDQSASCPCEEYARAATACWQNIVETKSPAAQCLYQGGYDPGAQVVSRVLCGIDGGGIDGGG